MNTGITVFGAGAWGTALAANFAKYQPDVTLWGRNKDMLEEMHRLRENRSYLQGVALPETLAFEHDIGIASKNTAIILLAVPAQHMRETVRGIAPHIMRDTILICCAKGIEQNSGMTMSAIIGQECPHNIVAALSGPSFAADVVRGLPTAVTVAAKRMPIALELCEKLSNKQFRCYASDDLIGVDYGGALKNVLAIAAGIVHGRGLGASALAAVTARGFAELQNIALRLGAKPETLTGLSGLGDLILTCASEKSRNFAYGVAVGRGDDLSNMKLAEGVATAKIAARIAAENNIKAPLISAVSAVLDGSQSIEQTIEHLMTRPIRSETK